MALDTSKILQVQLSWVIIIYESFNNHLIIHAGLLAIQNSPSLQNLSGFDELERVGMLVIAFLGNDMVDMDAFNSLRTAVTIIITRNMVCN